MTVMDYPTRTNSPDPDPNPAPAGPQTRPAAPGLAVAGRVLPELDPHGLLDNPHNPAPTSVT